ncbi:MAG: PPC domain-containing protein [Candidatus Sumerlaeia bacterium]|nr:PPC domain-containing protein [Candidatus Sumerlaeia bacterium]
MTSPKRFLLVVFFAISCIAWSQTAQRTPRLGYLYPAGGRQGTTFQVIVGGQYLPGPTKVHITGEGVSAKVIQYYRPIGNIQAEQRVELMERVNAVREKRIAEMSPSGTVPPGMQKRFGGRAGAFFRGQGKDAAPKAPTPATSAQNADKTKAKDAPAKEAAKTAPFRPVEHPLLYNLESKSLRELSHIMYHIFFPRQKRQMNAQIAEMVLIEVTIAPDAAPGQRELRLETGQGLTNPMVFEVGQLPEVSELEPNDPGSLQQMPGNLYAQKTGKAPQLSLPKPPPLTLPVLLNGQIMPGDVDRFSFFARKGQRLVMQASARRLIPYLADAVPGWFQATLTLYDARGNEIAFADDYYFQPDPVLFCEIPADGEYTVEIRDSIYRGREDFVYRVAIGELPFITAMFPLGGQAGTQTIASISGWNLTQTKLPLDTRPGASVRQAVVRENNLLSNEVAYAVGTLPECLEAEPNNNLKAAQAVRLPQVVNGRIAQPNDVDVFRFEGRAGDSIVAEVTARRLNSPMDSLVRLMDSSGKILAYNNDFEDKDGYLRREPVYLTHHADSYLMFQLPRDGVYYVEVSDSQQHGGEAFAYRLRLSPPQPDFSLCVTPSSLNIAAGRAVPVYVYALRKDGFDGEIELALKNAPAGFVLSGAKIPKGRDRVCMTLTAPRKGFADPVQIEFEGRAVIAGKSVTRPATPSEDLMQAFLYRHLTPSQTLMARVQGARFAAPAIELADTGPIRVPAGGTAQVHIKTPLGPNMRNVKLEARDLPKGVAVEDVAMVPGGVTFAIKADGEAVKAGFADNLIVEVFSEGLPPKAAAKAGPQRFSLGVLPAIPYEVVQR